MENKKVWEPKTLDLYLNARHFTIIPRSNTEYGYDMDKTQTIQTLATHPLYKDVTIRTKNGPTKIADYLPLLTTAYNSIDNKTALLKQAWYLTKDAINNRNEQLKQESIHQSRALNKLDQQITAAIKRLIESLEIQKEALFKALTQVNITKEKALTVLSNPTLRTKYLALAKTYGLEPVNPIDRTITFKEPQYLKDLPGYSKTENYYISALLSIHTDDPVYQPHEFISKTGDSVTLRPCRHYQTLQLTLDEDIVILQTIYLAKLDKYDSEHTFIAKDELGREITPDTDPAPTTAEEYRDWYNKHFGIKVYSYQEHC